MAFEFVGCKGMFDICTIIIESDFLCRLTFRKEQDIGFYPLGIEYTSRQAENGVQIEICQQLLSYRFTGTAFFRLPCLDTIGTAFYIHTIGNRLLKCVIHNHIVIKKKAFVSGIGVAVSPINRAVSKYSNTCFQLL